MAIRTSLVAQQVRIRQWAEQIRDCQNRSVTVRTVRKEWMLKPGVPRIILRNPITITGSGAFEKHALPRYQTKNLRLLRNCLPRCRQNQLYQKKQLQTL